jgi:uncharacterized protein (DUF1499 family)
MIHDVSTDPANPPAFIGLLDIRNACANGAHYSGLAPDAHAQRYPDLVTQHYAIEGDKVYDAALAFAESLGWKVAAADKANGRIEATATTRILRFKDDVVIRIRNSARGCALDARSASRVGQSDLGANARRLREYLRLVNSVLKTKP